MTEQRPEYPGDIDMAGLLSTVDTDPRAIYSTDKPNTFPLSLEQDQRLSAVMQACRLLENKQGAGAMAKGGVTPASVADIISLSEYIVGGEYAYQRHIDWTNGE